MILPLLAAACQGSQSNAYKPTKYGLALEYLSMHELPSSRQERRQHRITNPLVITNHCERWSGLQPNKIAPYNRAQEEIDKRECWWKNLLHEVKSNSCVLLDVDTIDTSLLDTVIACEKRGVNYFFIAEGNRLAKMEEEYGDKMNYHTIGFSSAMECSDRRIFLQNGGLLKRGETPITAIRAIESGTWVARDEDLSEVVKFSRVLTERKELSFGEQLALQHLFAQKKLLRETYANIRSKTVDELVLPFAREGLSPWTIFAVERHHSYRHSKAFRECDTNMEGLNKAAAIDLECPISYAIELIEPEVGQGHYGACLEMKQTFHKSIPAYTAAVDNRMKNITWDDTMTRLIELIRKEHCNAISYVRARV